MFSLMILPYLINLFPFIITGLIFLLFMNKIFKSVKNFKYVQNFVLYQKVLEYHMDRAYAIIHKDRLLIYSIEAMKVDDDDFAKVTKEYVELVIKMLGPMLYKELIFLYGNDETLLFTMVEYFNNKYEDDEIRETALENLKQTAED